MESYLAEVTATVEKAAKLAYEKVGSGPAHSPVLTASEVEAFEVATLDAITDLTVALQEVRVWKTYSGDGSAVAITGKPDPIQVIDLRAEPPEIADHLASIVGTEGPDHAAAKAIRAGLALNDSLLAVGFKDPFSRFEPQTLEATTVLGAQLLRKVVDQVKKDHPDFSDSLAAFAVSTLLGQNAVEVKIPAFTV